MSRQSTPLADRLVALAELAALADGRLDPELVADIRALVERAGERLQLSAEHTVVALAGATGSGKSSLFNALAGLDLSDVGVRRPTTAHPIACVWGANGAGPLLDWLGVPRRHQISRDSALDIRASAELRGLVLLDLPDHDSTELTHRLEVDRLVELVDVLVWVMDPQKYADLAVHERYLRPLSKHGDVTAVVLNQVDTVDPAAAAACLQDLGQLLADDGLGSVRPIATSARTGLGLDVLREVLVERVREHRAHVDRLSADVDRLAVRLVGQVHPDGSALGSDTDPTVDRRAREQLVAALAGAAGVPVVGQAVERTYRYRARGWTGWPFTRWLRRVRPDPLRRLHLGRDVDAVARSSLPAPTPALRAQVSTAVRDLVGSATRELPENWAFGLRATLPPPDAPQVTDALDGAITTTNLGLNRVPLWWRFLGALQLVFAVAALVGLGWLLVLFALAWFRIPEPPTPEFAGWPIPTLLALGGVAAGLLLSLLARLVSRIVARRRRRVVERRLLRAVSGVAQEQILEPLETELRRYGEARRALERVRV